MAQLDTGLGWSANETYLSAVAGKIGSMGGLTPQAPITGQPIPEYTTPADLANNGYLYMLQDNIFGYSQNKVACSEGAVVFCFGWTTDNGYRHYRCYISLSPNVSVYEIGVDREGHYGDVTTRKLDQTYGSPYGTYYYRSTWNAADGLTDYYPVFADLDTGMAYFSVVNQDIYKLFPGYAVVCFATWYTPAGNKITSPILISSEKDNAVLSYDGSSVATQIQESFLLNGKRFYMSYDLSIEGSVTSSFPNNDLTQFGAALGSKIFNLIASSSYSNILLTAAPPDPYEEQTDPSDAEGGDGEDLEDDPVEEETLPLPSVAGHGFCTIYVPSSQELGQMASYLWSGSFDVSQVLKLFSNPMDSILGLSAVPVSLSGTSEQIYLGGVALTGITMPKYTGRTSVKVDFGTVTVAERWGSYLDYAPYTDFSIYLPFIGIKPIKADDIMGKTISLMYAIDILSGGCVAYLRPAGGSVLYEWSGQCAVQIPVTGRSYDNVFQSAMSVATATLAAVAAPASAPVLSGAVASAAVQAAASKPHIERSGTVNGITGFLGQLRPYLIRTIPEAYIPADQNQFIGYPAYINVDLANVQGYNEVDSIHMENVTATGAELDEIETILKGGVIF